MMMNPKPGWGGAKRFYTAVAAVEGDEGWRIELDGRPIKTPGGALLAAGPRLAAAIAEEWDAQTESIDPTRMPATKALNTAIDRVRPNRRAVEDEIAGYGATDLVCYRAEAPDTLIAAERASWDPLIAWAEDAFAAPLTPITGVMHAPQRAESLAALTAAVRAETDLGLTSLHELTSLSGSLVIALAVRRGRLTATEGWRASRIDEEHQSALWGRDDEAEAAAALKAAAFADAARIGALADADDHERARTG